MNTRRGRGRPKISDLNNDTPKENSLTPTNNSAKKTMFTPCRRLGLQRKRATQNMSPNLSQSSSGTSTPVSTSIEDKLVICSVPQPEPSPVPTVEEKPKSTSSRRKKSSNPLKRTIDDTKESEGNTYTVLISPVLKKRKLELVDIFSSDSNLDLPKLEHKKYNDSVKNKKSDISVDKLPNNRSKSVEKLLTKPENKNSKNSVLKSTEITEKSPLKDIKTIKSQDKTKKTVETKSKKKKNETIEEVTKPTEITVVKDITVSLPETKPIKKRKLRDRTDHKEEEIMENKPICAEEQSRTDENPINSDTREETTEHSIEEDEETIHKTPETAEVDSTTTSNEEQTSRSEDTMKNEENLLGFDKIVDSTTPSIEDTAVLEEKTEEPIDSTTFIDKKRSNKKGNKKDLQEIDNVHSTTLNNEESNKLDKDVGSSQENKKIAKEKLTTTRGRKSTKLDDTKLNKPNVIKDIPSDLTDDFEDDFRATTPRTINQLTIKNKIIIEKKKETRSGRRKMKMDYSEFLSSEDSFETSSLPEKLTQPVEIPLENIEISPKTPKRKRTRRKSIGNNKGSEETNPVASVTEEIVEDIPLDVEKITLPIQLILKPTKNIAFEDSLDSTPLTKRNPWKDGKKSRKSITKEIKNSRNHCTTEVKKKKGKIKDFEKDPYEFDEDTVSSIEYKTFSHKNNKKIVMETSKEEQNEEILNDSSVVKEIEERKEVEEEAEEIVEDIHNIVLVTPEISEDIEEETDEIEETVTVEEANERTNEDNNIKDTSKEDSNTKEFIEEKIVMDKCTETKSFDKRIPRKRGKSKDLHKKEIHKNEDAGKERIFDIFKTKIAKIILTPIDSDSPISDIIKSYAANRKQFEENLRLSQKPKTPDFLTKIIEDFATDDSLEALPIVEKNTIEENQRKSIDIISDNVIERRKNKRWSLKIKEKEENKTTQEEIVRVEERSFENDKKIFRITEIEGTTSRKSNNENISQIKVDNLVVVNEEINKQLEQERRKITSQISLETNDNFNVKIVQQKPKENIVNSRENIQEESVFFTPPSSRSENDSDSNRNDTEMVEQSPNSSGNTIEPSSLSLKDLSMTSLTEIIGFPPSASSLSSQEKDNDFQTEDEEIQHITESPPGSSVRNTSRDSPRKRISPRKLSRNSLKTSYSDNFGFDSGSDDDFQSPRLTTTLVRSEPLQIEKSKQIIIKRSNGDTLNRTESFQITKSSSITALHKGNVVQYVKSNDIKRNTSERIVQPANVNDNKSIILERHLYKSNKRIASMFDSVVDDPASYIKEQNKTPPPRLLTKTSKKELERIKKEIIQVEMRIKDKQAKLERLKLISVYKRTHDLDELRRLTQQIKKGCQEALLELAAVVRQASDTPFDMETLLHNMHIPNDVVGYNNETDEFT